MLPQPVRLAHLLRTAHRAHPLLLLPPHARLRSTRLAAPEPIRHRLVRYQSTTPPPSTSTSSYPGARADPGPAPDLPSFGYDFRRPLYVVASTFYRLFRAAFIGSVVVVSVGLGGYTFAHLYVEMVGLEGDDLREGEDWDFRLERERWTGRRDGGKRGGGTDGRLGLEGQFLVRSAWMALHWGVGPDGLWAGGEEGRRVRDVDMFGFDVPAREYAYARIFLSSALRVAEGRKKLGVFPESDAAQDLVARYAELMERIGGRRHLLDARENWTVLCAELVREGRGAEAARVGGKVGDLGRRLGEEGEGWWVWAVRTASGEKLPLPDEHVAEVVPPPVENVAELVLPPSLRKSWFAFTRPSPPTPIPAPTPPAPSFLPTQLPQSPLAQRVIANTLVALSAAYASSSRLLPALALQDAALLLLPSPPSPSPSHAPAPPTWAATPSPPAQQLHTLTLLHARSLLTLHRSEVLFALSPTLNHPLALSGLLASASQSESLIAQLSGSPLSHPDFPQSSLPAPPAARLFLTPQYEKSVVLRDPAGRLLRDARRAAAHAWALAAVLHERKGEWTAALSCAERGLAWVGGEESLTQATGLTPEKVGKSAREGAEAGGNWLMRGAWAQLRGKGEEGGWEGLEVERREVWEVWRRVRERAREEVAGAKVVVARGNA